MKAWERKRSDLLFPQFLGASIAALFLTACGAGGSAVDAFFGLGKTVVTETEEVETPTELQVQISTPSSDGKKVGYQGLMTGTCSPSGKAVQISGDGISGFGVCIGGTWEADVDFSGAALGSVTAEVTLVDGERSSAAVTRIFQKDNTECDSSAARANTYANTGLGGDGGATPWTICTTSQFDNMRINPTHNFIMKNDIDFKSSPFNPLPTNFSGQVNGNDFTVHRLNINTPSWNETGLFRYLLQPGRLENITFDRPVIVGNTRAGLIGRTRNNGTVVINNVTIIDANVTAYGSGGSALVAYVDTNNTALISNINVTGSVTAAAYAGGVVGYTSGSATQVTLSNITTNLNVVSTGNYAGTVAGYISAPTNISSVTAQGAMTVAGYAGVVAGRINNGDVTDTTATGSISATNGYVGGTLGWFDGTNYHRNTSNVTMNANSANNAVSYVAGAIGYMNSATADIRDSTAVVNINASGDFDVNYVGGFTGRLRGVSVTNTRVSGSLSSDTVAGTMTVDSGDGLSTGGQYYGGFAAQIYANSGDNLSITGASGTNTSHVTMNITSADQDIYTGGFVGRAYTYDNAAGTGTITFTDITVDGDVTSKNRRVAGFGGDIYAGRNNSSITATRVTVNSNVTANQYGTSRTVQFTGGFAGTFYTRNGNGDAGPPSGGVHATDVIVNGNIVSDGSYVGGLAGYLVSGASSTGGATSNITRASVTGNVTANYVNTNNNYVGGILGYSYAGRNATVNVTATNPDEVIYTGTMTVASGSYHGGFVGETYAYQNSTINYTRARARTSINGSSVSYVGGMLGRVYSRGLSAITVTDSEAGVVASPATSAIGSTGEGAGGFIGRAETNTGGGGSGTISIQNSIARVNVTNTRTGAAYVGGFTGREYANVTHNNSTATGNITATGYYVAGFSGGSTAGNRTLTNCQATGNVTTTIANTNADVYAGGMVGYFGAGGTFSGNHASGDVTVNVTGAGFIRYAYTGGLVGYMLEDASESYAEGDVFIQNPGNTWGRYVGGAFGRTNNANISNVFAVGDVEGGRFVGGLIGYHRNGTITNSFAAGNVLADWYGGGLIGDYNQTSAASVDNVYATGSVGRIGTSTRTNRFGQLVGECANDGNVTDGYYNSTTSIVDAAVTSPEAPCNTTTARDLTPAQMLNSANFNTYDFVGTMNSSWRYVTDYTVPGGGAPYQFPVLYWMCTDFTCL